MTSLTALRPPPLFFFSSSSLFPSLSLRRLSSLPPSFSPVPPQRAQEPSPRFRLCSPLGFCSKRGSRWEDDVNLEAEIYEFMERSKNPNAFPTREELIAAGRGDLAEAIAREGGWFTLGWNLEQREEEKQEDAGISRQRSRDGPLDSCSSSGRSTEMEVETEACGIEGILSRLEKERSLSYGISYVEKRVNGKASWLDGEHDRGEPFLIANNKAVGSGNRSNTSASSGLDGQLFQKFGDVNSQKGTSADTSSMNASPRWRIWSFRRTGNPATEFEAAEIVPNEKTHVHQVLNDDVSVDEIEVDHSASKAGEENNGSGTKSEEICQNQIHLRLKHLESELTSALHLIRSTSEGVDSYKDQESSLNEFHRLSDELEFKQTEIMNAKDKLRSTRAKLAVQQGKMAHVLIEAQKEMDVRKKKLDALRLLRSVCIVWPNSASEVLLVGSFDGWTSQRKMQRSKSGLFTLHLKLYPGRYEIKFIVDGVWMVDPLRPTVFNNGYENNLLIIP